MKKALIPIELAERWASYTDGDTHNNAMPIENIVSMAQEIVDNRALIKKYAELLGDARYALDREYYVLRSRIDIALKEKI